MIHEIFINIVRSIKPQNFTSSVISLKKVLKMHSMVQLAFSRVTKIPNFMKKKFKKVNFTVPCRPKYQ